MNKIKEYFKGLKDRINNSGTADSARKTKAFIFKTEEPTLKELIIRLVISVALLILGIMPFVPKVLSIILLIIAFLVCSYDMIIDMFRGFKAKKFFRPVVAITAAGIIAMLVGDFADAVLFVVLYRVFLLLSERVVKFAVKRTRDKLDVRVKDVRLFSEDKIVVVPIEEVKVDDIYMVTPGDRIPLDGIVHNGVSELDLEPLTGEAVTRKVKKDSVVFSGCLNVSGTISVRVTADIENSIVTKRLNYIEGYEAFEEKSKPFCDKLSKILMPVAFIIGLLFAVVIPFIVGDYPGWLRRSAMVFAAASPLPLLLSNAITYFAGTIGAAENGVLIKNRETLDSINNIGCVVFDKDGTLSTGRYTVKAIESKKLMDDELITLASYAVANSVNPAAKAILANVIKAPDKSRIKNYYEDDGRCCIVQLSDDRVVAVGTAEMLEMMGVPVPVIKAGYTTVYVCVGREYVGCIHLQDKVRADAFDAVSGLKELKINDIRIISSDSDENVAVISESFGVDNVYRAVNDKEKADVFEQILESVKGNKGKLAYMSSDFDVPELFEKADVGAALNGLVSDEAIENANLVLVKSEPSRLCAAVRGARNIKKTALVNLIIVAAITAIVVITAMFVPIKLSILVILQWLAAFGTVFIATQAYNYLKKRYVKSQKPE